MNRSKVFGALKHPMNTSLQALLTFVVLTMSHKDKALLDAFYETASKPNDRVALYGGDHDV